MDPTQAPIEAAHDFSFLGPRRYVAEISDPLAPGGVSRSNGLWITYGF